MSQNPKERQQWILDELKQAPFLSYVDMWAKYRQMWSKGKTTFDKDWKQAQEQYQAYQKKANKEKEKVSIKEEVKAFKKGLKTRFERLLILQEQVDNCLSDLQKGQTTDTMVIDGKSKAFERKMTLTEYNQTRRTLKELQAEISKIQGDYASEKVSVFVEQPLFGD